MSAWAVFIWLTVCVFGAICFLAIVANGLESVSVHLRRLEEQERFARRRRQEKADAETATVEVSAAA